MSVVAAFELHSLLPFTCDDIDEATYEVRT